eukprot:191773_1
MSHRGFDLSLSHDPEFRRLIDNLQNHSDNNNVVRGPLQPIRFDPGYTNDGQRYAIIGGSDDDDNHHKPKRQRQDDIIRQEQEEQEAELLKQHKQRVDALQSQIEQDHQRHSQEKIEEQRLFEIERTKKEEAQTKAEEERVEKERIKKESDKNVLLNELEMVYWKVTGVNIPNIKRLNDQIHSKYNNEYLLNYHELRKEHDRLNEYHIDVLNDPNIQQFVLLGRTGDGKSTFGNRLCGDYSQSGDSGPFQTGFGVNSVTSSIKRSNTITLQNKRISIVDTPGIFDTNDNDNFHLNEVIEHLRGANGINAFVMCCRAGRLDIKYQEMFRDLESMLTPSFWSNVIVVVTYCQDQYAMHWERAKRDLWQTINRKLNLRHNAFKPYQIVGVNNKERNSYSLCINQVLSIVNDPNKFNQRRFHSDELVSPIDKLKTNTLRIQNDIESLISQRDNHKSEMVNAKQNLSQTINKCSAFQVDSKYANCLNSVDGILNELTNNNCILHDLSDIHHNVEFQQTQSYSHNNYDDEMKCQQQLSQDQLNIIQSQLNRLDMTQSLPILSYETLKSRQFSSDIDRRKLEQYLSDAEFLQLFQCTKSEFKQKKPWKQQALKKQFKLF